MNSQPRPLADCRGWLLGSAEVRRSPTRYPDHGAVTVARCLTVPIGPITEDASCDLGHPVTPRPLVTPLRRRLARRRARRRRRPGSGRRRTGPGTGGAAASPHGTATPTADDRHQPRDRQRLPRAHRAVRARPPASPGSRRRVNQICAPQNPNTIFAAAGDMIGASTFTSFIQQDVPTIETLNAAGLDVSSVGNHEFDRGLRRPHATASCRWPTGSTSARTSTTRTRATPRCRSTGSRRVDGVRVGFVGAVTEELPVAGEPGRHRGHQRRKPGRGSVTASPTSSATADRATAKPTSSILLVHEGAATTDIASATDPNSPLRPDRAERRRQHRRDRLGSHAPRVQPRDRRDGPVISSGQYGERFSNMEIALRPPRRSRSCSMENTIYTMATAFDAAGNVTAWLTEPDPATRPDRGRGRRPSRQNSAVSSLGDGSGELRPRGAAEPRRRAIVPREPRWRVDARQLRGRRAEVVAQLRPDPRRPDRLHEPGRPARRPGVGSRSPTPRRPRCSRSPTRSCR